MVPMGVLAYIPPGSVLSAATLWWEPLCRGLIFVALVWATTVLAGRFLLTLGRFLHEWDIAGPVYRRLAVPARR